MSVKVHFPVLPLQEAVAKGGGITRENAVKAALEGVRAMSGEGDKAIDDAIKVLETIVASAPEGLTPDQLRAVLDQSDQIVNMAGTFAYETLDRASRSLCDIADGLLRQGLPDVEPVAAHVRALRQGLADLAPVAVHVRALRLFSPLGTQLPREAANHVLGELSKVAAHYNFSSLDK